MAKKKVYLAQQSALDSHIGDSTHVTAAEKKKIADALTGDNVVPSTDASLTKLIATIGGKQIKAPEGGGGGGGGLTGHKLTIQAEHGGRFMPANDGVISCLKSDGTMETISWHNGDDGFTRVIENVVCFALIAVTPEYYNAKYPIILAQDWRGSMFWLGFLTSDFEYQISTGCFVKGQLVTLADRTEKPIEEISYDDELLVWDFDNGCYSSAKPAWIKRREETTYYFRNRYASGHELLTTGQSETGWGHRHYDITRNEFRYTPTTVGDSVFTLDGVDEHLSCEKVSGACEFYNIITERHFNLFANGILTSCSLSNFRPMKGMRFVDDGVVRALPFSVFRPFVPCEDEAKVRRYYDALRVGDMSADGVAKLGDYVGRLIAREAV